MPENVPCKWCGMEMPADAEKCPWCYRAPVRPRQPEPGGPAEPAAGAPHSAVVAAPVPQYGVVMYLAVLVLAAEAIAVIARANWLGIVLPGLMLWGILSRARWGFWLVVVLASLGILGTVAALIFVHAMLSFVAQSGDPQLTGLWETAVSSGHLRRDTALLVAHLVAMVFVLLAVITHRDRFR